MIGRSTLKRRAFLGMAWGLGTNLPALSWSRVARGASRVAEIRIAVIGTGVRGKHLMANLPEDFRVVAVCDAASSRVASALQPSGSFVSLLQRFSQRDAAHCAAYQDYRRLFDREKLDAAIIATPDHHHVLAAMLALEAGCDVYVEKPLTLCIAAGRRLVEQVRRTGRVVQVGSQQRTMEMNRFGCEFIRDGGLGRVHTVELPNYPGPLPEFTGTPEPIPKDLNWEMLLGPAPLRAHSTRLWVKDEFKVGQLLWRGWDLFRDYSGHMMTNWGAHSIDMVQYALGKDATGPVRVRSMAPAREAGLGDAWKDKTPLPTSVDERRFWPVEMEYADGTQLQFVLGQDSIRFHGEKGVITMRRNFVACDPPELLTGAPDQSVLEKWEGTGHVARPHLENWREAIVSGTQLNAPIEVGHRTVTVCHLANLARELDRPLRWQPEHERFIDDEEANALLDRPRRTGFELPG